MTEEERHAVQRQKEAEEWKNKGNLSYKEKRFEEAIGFYDQAI